MTTLKSSWTSVAVTLFSIMLVNTAFAQNTTGLPNASGNQPIYGAAQATTAIGGIQGNPAANITGYTAAGPSPGPWFGNDEVRQQFGLTEGQFYQMQQNYWQAYQSNNQARGTYDPNQVTIPRTQRMQQGPAYANYSSGPAYDLRVPPIATGYNEMNPASRFYNAAYEDMAIQNQMNQINQTNQNSSRQGRQRRGRNQQQQVDQQDQSIANFRNQMRIDPLATSSRFSNGRDEMSQRFNPGFNTGYSSVWNQSNNYLFEYPVDVYFTSGGTVAPFGR